MYERTVMQHSAVSDRPVCS